MEVSVVPHHHNIVIFVFKPSKSLKNLLNKYIDIILSVKELTENTLKIVVVKNKRSENFIQELEEISDRFEISRILPN